MAPAGAPPLDLLVVQPLRGPPVPLAADLDRDRLAPLLTAEVGQVARLRPGVAILARRIAAPLPRLQPAADEEVQLEPERREERQPHRDPDAHVVRQEEPE